MGRNYKCVCLFVGVCLLIFNISSVESRAQTKSHAHDFYGAYNPCKYNIWPWPSNVDCTSTKNRDRVLSKDFQVFVTEESLAKNSSILLKAIERYKTLITNQPIRLTRGRFVEPQFRFEGDDDDMYQEDLSLSDRSSLTLDAVELTVSNDHDDTPKLLDDDESYEISIDDGSSVVSISSATIWGALYGLDTFSQIVEAGNRIRHTPLRVNDSPRYPWRGFLLDTSNHFISIDSIFRLIEGMSANKLNTLHWHIVDSYSFPYMSEVFPELSRSGSWSSAINSDRPSAAATASSSSYGQEEKSGPDNRAAVYSLDDIRAVVRYCSERGIRVVPEMDIPGHAYSWGLSDKLQDITVSCPRYTDELGHVDDVPLDPTREETYDVLNELFAEMKTVFSDPYFHIGGDEVKYGCWNESEAILSWMADHGVPKDDFYTLEQYFFERVGSYCTKELSHILIAWEEVFFSDAGGTDGEHGVWIGSPALPPETTMVESWTGPDYLEEACYHGYDAILAYGWYLDRQNPVDGEGTWFFGDSWAQMYGVDPEPISVLEDIRARRKERGLSEDMSTEARRTGGRGRALGGELSMWTEQVDDNNIDSQVWPRAGAAAERLWSSQDIVEPASAAPRLSHMRCRLVSRFGIRAGPVWSDHCMVYEA